MTTLTREQAAFALSTHLCYTGVRPQDKSIDAFLGRLATYTPEKEQRRQADLDEAWNEYMNAQVEP